MASRATVQHAVELLKIHQIRRENAAIHEQIEKLRGELSNVHDANDNLRQQISQASTESHKAHALAVKNKNLIDNVDRQMESLTQDKRRLHSLIQATQQNCKDHHKTAQDALADELAVQIRDAEHKCTKTHTETLDKITSLQGQVNQNHDDAHSSAVHKRLCALENSLAALQTKDIDTGSPSRIVDSVEEVHISGANDTISSREPATICIRDDILQTIVATPTESTCSAVNSSNHNGLGMLPKGFPFNNRESTLPNDLDLDEATAGTSHVGHGLDYRELHNSPIVYIFEQELDDTSLAIQDSKDIASSHGIEDPELASSRTHRDTDRTVQGDPLQIEPFVLVAATDSLQQDERPTKNRKAVAQKVGTISQAAPRRSQRLIEKTQTNGQSLTSAAQPTKTHSQAKAANARAAETSKKSKTGSRSNQKEQLIKAIPSKHASRTSILESAHTSGIPNGITRGAGKSRQALNTTNTTIHPMQPAAHEQIQIQSNRDRTAYQTTHRPKTPDSSATPSNPVTPTPQPPPASRPPDPKPKPLNAKPRASTLTASLYNPRPRLVPQKRKPPANLVDETASDPDVSLPLPEPQRKRHTVSKSKSKAADSERQTLIPPRRKKPHGKTKLPPPRTVPILSSSSGGEHRFDRW